MSKHLIKVRDRLIFIFLPMFSVSVEGIAAPLFTDSFETGDKSYSENGISWLGSESAVVSTENPRSGTYSLKFTFTAAPSPKDSWAEQRFDLGSTYPEVWIQYYIYFPDGTEGLGARYAQRNDVGPDNNKFLRLWGNIPRTSNSKSIVGGGASMWPSGPSNIHSKLGAEYFTTFNGSVVLGMDRNGIQSKELVTDLTIGRWIKFKYHRKVASSANNDGVIQIWLDDVLVTDERNLTGYPGDGYQNAYTAGYLLGWSNSGFDKETYIYIDDVAFSRSNDFEDSVIKPPAPPSAVK